MTTFLATSVQLTEINCGVCGGTYAINETYRVELAARTADSLVDRAREWEGR